MAKRDYYEVLDVPKTATQDEIKKSYRKKAMEHHPDKGGDEAIFKELAEAYEVLSDETKKAQYDTHGHNAPKFGSGGAPFDVFNEFFKHAGFSNTPKPQTRVGSNMNMTIKLTLEEIFNGTNKKFKYKRHIHCTPCSGKGGTGIKQCTNCGGIGMVTQVIHTPFGQIHNQTYCPVCNGGGETYENICVTCSGEGVTMSDETIDVTIPSGVVENMSFVLTGKGHFIKNGTAGDLVATIIEVPHPTFVRSGNDLKMNVKLTYPQLVLGDKVEVPTIDGGKIRITVPEYTKIETKLQIQNKGMKQLNTNNRGDMILTIELDIPTSIDDKERELILELKKLSEKIVN